MVFAQRAKDYFPGLLRDTFGKTLLNGEKNETVKINPVGSPNDVGCTAYGLWR